MLKEVLYKYLHTTCSTVAAALEQLEQPSKRQEAIHVIRVGGKKIRALLALAAQLPEYDLKTGRYLSALKLLQQIGGISRDTQLQEKFLAKHEKTVAWRFSVAHLLLKTKQGTADVILDEAIRRSSLKKISQLPEKFREAIAHIDNETATTALIIYVADQYNSIALPASNAHHTVWHELRKHMKTLYYQLSIITSLPTHSSLHKTQLRHTQKAGELLGKWHDANELLLFIKTTIARMKKEKIDLPVNATQLVQLLQEETKTCLADSVKHIKLLGVS